MSDPRITIEEGIAEYEAQLAQARADLAQSQADDASDDAAYEQRLTDLRAEFEAYKKAFPAVKEPSIVEFSDFAMSRTSGMDLKAGSLTGDGNTIYRMKPMSSTKVGIISALVKGASNPHRLMVAGGDGPATAVKNLDIGGFALQGTEQGHMYGGLRVGYSVGARLHDLIINAIPGNAPGPPGETFALATFHTDAALLDRVVLDGRNAAGKAVTATALGYNFNSGRTVANDVKAIYAAYGFAVAMWRCTGEQIFNNCDFRYGRKAINIEQTSGGSYEFNNCDFRSLTGSLWQAQISAINASAKVVFRDPVVDAYPFRVRTYGPTANSEPGGNVQKDADISCFINGKDVTNDSSKFVFMHSDS